MPTELSQPSDLSGRKLLVIAVLLAALIHAVLVATSPAIARDGMTFIAIAKVLTHDPVAILRGCDQHPGYPAIILAGRWVVSPFVQPDSISSWVWGARVASGVFAVLTVAVVWLLVRRMFDEQVAGISAIAVAVLPPFSHNAADVLSDTPHLFFYVLAVWLTAEGMIRRRWALFLAAGAAGGLAYWIRPEGLSVAIVTVAILPLWAWRRKAMKPRRVLLCLGVMLAAAAAVSLPYCVVAGKLSSKITNKEYLLPRANTQEESGLPDVKPATAQPPVTGPLAAERAEEKTTTWELIGDAIAKMVEESAHSLRWVLLLPLVLGVFAVRRREPDKVPGLLIGGLVLFHALLLIWLYYAGRYVSYRHVMIPVLLGMPWLGCGAVLIADKLCSLLPERAPPAAGRRRRWILAGVIFLPAAVLGSLGARGLHAREVPVVEAAVRLGKHARPGDAVFANSQYVPFFAEMPGRVLTEAEAEAGVSLSDIGPPHRFVVLDTAADYFRPEWLTELSGRYEPFELPGVGQDRLRVFVLRSAGSGKP